MLQKRAILVLAALQASQANLVSLRYMSSNDQFFIAGVMGPVGEIGAPGE